MNATGMPQHHPPARTSAERDTHDIARGAGVNYLGYAVRLGSRAPFLVLAGLLYGPARFGRYTFAVAVVEMVAAFALFGQRRSLFKFMSEAVARQDSVHRAIANAFAVSLTAGTVLTLAVAVGAGQLTVWFDVPSAAGPLLLIAPTILLIAMMDTLLVAIRFTRAMRYEVMARSIAEPIALTITVVVAYLLGADENGLFIAYEAALLVAAAVTVRFFFRIYPFWDCLRTELSWADMRRLLGFSGPTAVYDLSVIVATRVDVFFVTYFYSDIVIGVYGMAGQLSTFTKRIRQGFDPILSPVVSQSVEAGDMRRVGQQVALVSRWILSAQVPIVLALGFYGQYLLELVGHHFAAGAVILTILAIGEAINGSLGVSEVPIFFTRPVANLAVGATMLLSSIGFGYWLTGAAGPEGAAAAVVVTYVIVNALRIGMNRRMLNIVVVQRALLKPIVAGLIAGAAVAGVQVALAALPTVRVLVGILVLVGSYLGSLYLLGLETEDRAQLRRVARRLPGRWAGPVSPGGPALVDED